MRNALLVFVLLLLAAPGRGEEPRFLLESFRVAGMTYGSSSIVIAESRLRPGRSYSEADLGDAMRRIERLPFVLFAEFRLEKGTAPGTYVLAIVIRETKPIFFSARSQSSRFSTREPVVDRSLPSTAPPEYRSGIADFRNEYLTVGGRLFIGARGVAHVAAELQREDRYSIGYTHYDFFGTGASITALVSYQDRQIDGLPGLFGQWHRSDDFSYQLLATVPVTMNQSIRASLQRSVQPVPRTEPSGVPGNIRYLLEPAPSDRRMLTWLYDTTNDSLFPTDGTLVTAGVDQFEFSFAGTEVTETRTNTHVAITSEKFFPLGSAQTVSAGLDLHRRGLDEIRPHARYGVSLWSRERTLRHGDLRFEATIDRSWLLGPADGRSASSTASAGIAFRNAWGIVRLDFEYVGWRRHE